MESLPAGSKVVCMGGTVRLVTQQIFYKFRQSTDFFYLTGFHEPDSILVLESKPSIPRGYTYTLYVPPKDAHEEQWEGARTGPDSAVSNFGADTAYPNTTFASHITSIADTSNGGNLYIQLPSSPSPSPASSPYPPPEIKIPKRKSTTTLGKFLSNSSLFPASVTIPPHLALHALLQSNSAKPLAPEVEKLRIVKSPAELNLMKRAGDISSAAHASVMRATTRRGLEGKQVDENFIQAEFEYRCAIEGSERAAYVPVVASGSNGCVIHYTQNDQLLQPGEMVLLDAGCEFSHYASDITRTFPVTGKFSEPQKDLYQAVLNVQKECVKRCLVEDEIGMNDLHRLSCSLMMEELKQIGFKLYTGDVERRLYPHYISHHLGSDLHDCSTQTRNGPLVEGNVVTIEPGCYVPMDDAFPKAFQGLGVRIEDAIAFTKDGPLNLSANAPKEIVDVEGTCQGLLEA